MTKHPFEGIQRPDENNAEDSRENCVPEGRKFTAAMSETGGRPVTAAMSETGGRADAPQPIQATTRAMGEEGGGRRPGMVTTQALGEEGGGPGTVTTMALGEEGGWCGTLPQNNYCVTVAEKYLNAMATVVQGIEDAGADVTQVLNESGVVFCRGLDPDSLRQVPGVKSVELLDGGSPV